MYYSSGVFFLLFATFCARAPYAAISFLNFFLLLLNLIECTITVITRIKVTALWNIAPRIMATTANIATMVLVVIVFALIHHFVILILIITAFVHSIKIRGSKKKIKQLIAAYEALAQESEKCNAPEEQNPDENTPDEQNPDDNTPDEEEAK